MNNSATDKIETASDLHTSDKQITMQKGNVQFSLFDEKEAINELKRYLPAQAPLKDFIFQNTLKAYQSLKFDQALRKASAMFGYRVSLSLKEYRALHKSNKISDAVLEKIIADRKGTANVQEWKEKALQQQYTRPNAPRIGALRAKWKKNYKIDLDSLVHPTVFRIVCSYLDQGISIWNFPVWQNGFLPSIKEMEKNSFTSFFRTKRVKELLLSGNYSIHSLLKQIVGDESYFKQYLFDQQFAHQGWSGMVSVIEDQPQTLIDPKKISMKDLITLELLLEIDALDSQFGENKWAPLSEKINVQIENLFAEVHPTELEEVILIWQLAFEWSYYDQVLAGIQLPKSPKKAIAEKSFQAMFCIDDRECSLRRYLEKFDTNCETFGTPGFFNVEFYFQPEKGRHYTKLCPAPVTPKYLIKEIGKSGKREKDVHFTKETHSLIGGFLISQTLGFWSAFKLFINIFKPSMSPATASSLKHMNRLHKLTIVNTDPKDIENGLQVGFTIEEMANRVEGLLKSIGLVKDFAPIIYVIGHGASSVNNPFYATMDCGACSCRPGSVNARVLCFAANHPEVRAVLASRGLVIPSETHFLGGIHDTTRDDIVFFDEDSLTAKEAENHQKNQLVFTKALAHNSKERSRRFESIDTRLDPEKIHEKVQIRSVSLFEPRPELDHATNALCIVGSRNLTKDLFLDRRAFMNSYDHKIDPEGKYLFNILKAATPVCGDINLQFFFSRVDNQKLGAGTKLPHNVMGLFGVANGIDGDLRPGLPNQMIESHDPIRLMMIVQHYPEVVLKTIQSLPAMYEYYANDWVYLTVIHPDTGEALLFKDGSFTTYKPINTSIATVSDIMSLIENSNCQENIPVHLIS